jgi:predicted helicase
VADNNAEALQGVLTNIRQAAQSERDKGTAFERLVKEFLVNDALWAEKFSDVWMWSDWPERDGRGDAGIDLVAKDADTGELWAIQAKFYDPSHALQKGDIDSFFTESGKAPFNQRMIISTTDNWSAKAEEALEGQQIPVTRVRLMDLAESTLDWSTYKADQPSALEHFAPRQLRAHQVEALENVSEGFKTSDRGKMIMACGTGKTFTSLRIAEHLAGVGGRVLFLVPSISLLQQTLREWTNYSEIPLRSFAVCSDTKIGKKQEDISVHDLQYPATTNPMRLAQHATAHSEGKLTVIFATYQSIQVVAEAQADGLPEFDVIICDEAHRTTGVTLAENDESNFVRVHDADFVKGKKRLYMTATPRLFSDDSKSKADEIGAVIASMDDESVFGPEFYRLGFGEAVERDLLSDYKVLVLAVDESYIARAFQEQLADENHELKLDDAAKIIGCWNGLSKRRVLQTGPDGQLEDPENIEDPIPMSRAVAFAKSIKDSKRLVEMFGEIVNHYTAATDDPDLLHCETQHVDGTFNVLQRNERLDWLKAESPENTCRILSNARCLSEGVDVPALDAVLFLNPRNSTVDVVQSVGRVMRKHKDKKYGYVILPIGIPAGMTPEEALADHQRYKVVWQVLQALRAHDDRFNAMVNKIELNKNANDKVQVIGVGDPSADGDNESTDTTAGVQGAFIFPNMDLWRDAILAKLVQKVGDRRYWEDWAKDIAQIAERHVTRIQALLDNNNTKLEAEFDAFLLGLRGNLNDSISRNDAIEMLAQHLITKPVFDALFEDYSFASANPVSQVMERMLDALDEHSLEKESETLDKFYESVRMRASGIDNAEGKQRIIIELYEKFFKNAFPRVAAKLGIVYTPIEIVDYILNSVQVVLKSEFNTDLSAEGVHVLDPFTGTGTFIARLIQSGLIAPNALERKYRKELHANELVLLAYYIAAINIEATYHGVHGGKYEPFDGIVLTDTFQMYEDGDPDDTLIFPINNERVAAQKKAPIRVIVGNPPYSVGQDSENDSNKNVEYPTLDAHIKSTYARRSSGTNLNSLYDSYIRAVRWASDRIGDHGVIAYITNGGWLDNTAMDGFRKTLDAEFSSLWAFNLRGNARTSGIRAKEEGGNVFPIRTPVAITILVKKENHTGPCEIHYQDIGDYLNREEKLTIIDTQQSVTSGNWETIAPNDSGDWINKRDEKFGSYQVLGDKKNSTATPVFETYSMGVQTKRDAWAYNSSRSALEANMKRMIDNYDSLCIDFGIWCRDSRRQRDEAALEDFVRVNSDPSIISWSRGLKRDLLKDKRAAFAPEHVVMGMYRPFFKQVLYFDRQMNDMILQNPKYFPRPTVENLVICMNAADRSRPFGALITNVVPNMNMHGAGSSGQGFPMYHFDESQDDNLDNLFSEHPDVVGLSRHHAITDFTLARYQKHYGGELAKEDIFYFVYGLLHSREYIDRYQADLSKMIPRIPLVKDFWGFSKSGRSLADWHLNYESVEPWELEGLPPANASAASLRVEKMKFAKSAGDHPKSTIIANSHYIIAGIPEDAYRYTVNGKSAIEWLIERYQVKIEKDSQILNDPNLYSDDPRYIIDLVARMVRVSVESVAIMDSLPKLEIIE